MQPHIGQRQQLVQCVAKPGGAWAQAIARVRAVQAGRKVSDHHCGPVKGHGQRLPQPGLAGQPLFAQGLGQQRLTTAQAVVFLQVVVGGPVGFFTRLELLAQRGGTVRLATGRVCAQRVKVRPQCAAHKAHTAEHHGLPLQPDQPQAGAGLLQAGMGLVKVQAVVLVVAWHKQHRRGPGRATSRHRQR